MLQLQRLSLAGFKSFADPVELYFGDGLTGVVGPNGCGKSNVVEALRWVMGESRAKALRGSELEDIIFAGTNLRPARGLAEVRLTLINPDRDAPVPYMNAPEIEIVRTVTRANGSSYKINGRPARARDVHLFLSEANTGSSSPAFVTQGHVASLISAKPESRREMIEEAAGINGLYIRRREAEQRLNAASGNLTRVQDIMHGLGAQIEHLATQAEDARKYTALSERIQILEAAIAGAEWNRLRDAVQSAQANLTQKLTAKNEAEAALAGFENNLETARTQYASLKRDEEIAKAALAAIDNECVRLSERLASRTREADLLRQQSLGLDAQDAGLHATIARLQSEQEQVEATLALQTEQALRHTETLARLSKERETARVNLADADKVVEIAKAAVMTAKAALDAALIEREKLNARLNSVMVDVNQVAATLREATTSDGGTDHMELRQIETELTAIEEKTRAAAIRENALTLETKNLSEQTDALRPQKTAAEKALAALEAEYAILQKTLAAIPADTVLGEVRAAKGYDRALAVALGEAAQAGLNADTADFYWSDNAIAATLPALPGSLSPLSAHVDGAARLSPMLAMIGVAGSADEAERLFAQLQPGQMIVTRDGGLWRWDGLRVKASYTPAAAHTLSQRERAAVLGKQIAKDGAAIEQMMAHEKDLAEQVAANRASLDTLRTEKNQTAAREQELQGRRRKIEQRIQEQELRLTGLRARLTGLDEERARIETRLAELGTDAAGAIDPALHTALEDAQIARQNAWEADDAVRNRLTEAETQSKIDANHVEASKAALARIAADTVRAHETLKTHDEAKIKTIAQIEAVTADTAAITQEVARLQGAKTDKQQAVDACVAASGGAAETLRDQEASGENARKNARASYEAWVDAGAKTQTLQTQWEELTADIETRFGVVDPAQLALTYPTPEGNATVWLAERTKLVVEREEMGLINMKAPEEYDTAKTQFDTLDKERSDLAQAISELSGTIERINKDARARLTATVDQVNELFGPLFIKLFGGGQASLVWTKADDILQAGVEIMAQPPGKKLQSLSLLSGGEQALTAIAMILAMVRTHPAPVCVFDEIDAALDESNVDRVSQALVELSRDSGARLIVVTHHRLMMSRLDRLYGVTMAERGVSKLVSVDLHKEPQLFSEDEGGRVSA